MNRESAPIDALGRTERAGAFLPHVHMLRGVAILIVVGAHCWPSFSWSPLQMRFIRAVFENVTVVMMFISGMLFQHLSARFRYTRYLKRRFSMLILPYVIVSIPALVIVIFFMHRDDVWPWVYSMPVWKQAGFFLLTGKHMAPLWFMPMITLFILAAPVFLLIDRRNWYPVLLPMTMLIALRLGRDADLGLGGILGKAVFMLPAYLAGMTFSRHRAAAEAWSSRHLLLIAGAVVVLSGMIVAGWFEFIDLTLLQKLLLGISLITLFKHVEWNAMVADGLSQIADQSFAIYFLHGYAITGLRLVADHVRTGVAAVGTPVPGVRELGLLVLIAFATIFSMLTVQLFRFLFGRRSRMIVGA